MPFTKKLKDHTDIDDLMMYELISMMQINFAERISDKYKDELFLYYTKDLQKIIDNQSYSVQNFMSELIKESNESDRTQLVYDSIEDDADEFLKGVLEGLTDGNETFGEMIDRIERIGNEKQD